MAGTVFHRQCKYGESSPIYNLIGHHFCTYGGWFIPQANAFLLGTIYFAEDVAEDILFAESPTGWAHLVEAPTMDIYEV